MLEGLLMWAFAFIFSTTAHEAAHALVAKLGGDATAYEGGQVSMNPVPHMKREPMGMILVPLVSFWLYGGNWMLGWASAPYNPDWAYRHPKRSALMALAGPASNLLIFFVTMSLYVLFDGMSAGADGESILFVFKDLFAIFSRLNLVLFVFNMFPLPPLDGSEIILLFVPRGKEDKVRQVIRQIGIIGLFVAWMVFPRVYPPVANFFFGFFGYHIA